MSRKGTAKLEELLRIEEEIRGYWLDQKTFEADAADDEKLKGKRTLWPFGLHCTGTPIRAAADKLVRECDQFGCPPSFPTEKLGKVYSLTEKAEVGKDPSKSKKSKAVAKAGDANYQWQIMESLGLGPDEIPKFMDASYWLKYFPGKAIDDLKRLGIKVDWRRSFITTDANPFYDSFVRWQFLCLRKMGKIQYGKRYTIFSPRDNQPCMDHERSEGEGVVPQEYTLIKLEILSEVPKQLGHIDRKKEPIFLVAATLRPETMYGQTNCWLHPDIDYVAVRSNRESCIIICTERAANNMAYQGILYPDEPGKIDILARLKGTDLFGSRVRAPLSQHVDGVYALPMLSIKANKGTGVVTSVPSDSPDDWAALRDLRNKPALREKFGITEQMVLPFEPIPILETQELGNVAAVTIVDQMKIQSQNDTDKLQLAKERVYRVGFYDGIMLVGDYKGSKVHEAKKKVQTDLLNTGQAITYYEPERSVVSRSGDNAVVALCDQWYLNYGEANWRALTQKALDQLTAVEEVRRCFDSTLDWLHEHACSRTYGLGTHLPWDDRWLIESLSDSTIYMAYYTVSHLLQGKNSLEGLRVGPLGIRPENMTPEVWDFIFLGHGDPAQLIAAQPKRSSLSVDVLRRLRGEFLYWYPVDLRTTGKDLIPNHLTYYLYNHTAIWPDEPQLWPQSVLANGHLMLNSEKMSKSTGNFLTLSDAINKYSADGVRLALADAGDSLDDANVKEEMAEAGLLRLYSLFEWVTQTVQQLDNPDTRDLRTDARMIHADLVFRNDMRRTVALAEKFYASHQYKEVLKTVFYEFQTCRDRYREVSLGSMHRDLLREYVRLQTLLLSPICSHVCEYIWRKLLGEKQSIFLATWPSFEQEPMDELITRQGRYVDDCAHQFRIQLAQRTASKAFKSTKTKSGAEAKGEASVPPSAATVWVCKEYPPWQAKILEIMRDNLSADGQLSDKATLATLLRPHLKDMGKMSKRAMPFAQLVRDRFEARGAIVLDSKLEVDEYTVLLANKEYMMGTLSLVGQDGLQISHLTATDDVRIIEAVSPLSPIIVFHDPPPSVPIQFINPDVGSGLFSLSGVPVCDGDSTASLVSRLLRTCHASMPDSKHLQTLTLYRFVNPDSDPFLMNAGHSTDMLKPIEPSDRFQVDVATSSVMLTVSGGTAVSVGDRLIYRAGVRRSDDAAAAATSALSNGFS